MAGCFGNHWVDRQMENQLMRYLDEYREDDFVHPKCKETGVCQETEGFKGTEYEGINVCEDGCVWYKPEKK